MNEIEVELRATVTLDLPEGCEPESLTMDDLRSMACTALGHNHNFVETQLVKQDIAQTADLEEFGASEPVMVGVWVDVDWDSIEKIR